MVVSLAMLGATAGPEATPPVSEPATTADCTTFRVAAAGGFFVRRGKGCGVRRGTSLCVT